MSFEEDIQKLMLKTKEILDILENIDSKDPLLLETYLIIESLQIQLLGLISDYQIILNKKIENENLKNKILESKKIVLNSYENIQKIIEKSYIYRRAKITLINLKSNF